MKKYVLIVVVLLFLAGCSSTEAESSSTARSESISSLESSIDNSSESTTSVVESKEILEESSINESTEESITEDKVYDLNETVIFYDNQENEKFSVTFIEAKDVTEEEIQKYGGYENTWINTYSNGVGKQLIRITWKIHNISDSTPFLPYPIGLKVRDEVGENSPGGWINHSSNIMSVDTEFIPVEMATVFEGDIATAAGYYILTNPSNEIEIEMTSTRYNETKEFELEIQ